MNLPKHFFKNFFLVAILLNINFLTKSFASNYQKEILIASKYTKSNISYNNFALSKVHKKATIIIFWASWCSGCPDKLIFLENLYQKYQSQGLEIVAINIDNGKNIKNFIKLSNKISFFNVLIKNITESDLPMPTSLPEIYLIDETLNVKKINIMDLKSINIFNSPIEKKSN